MPFKIFRMLFPRSTRTALHVMKNNSVILKTYKHSGIEQLDVCTVRLRHKDKNAKCRFPVVSEDGPALLGMLDTKLLDIIMIIVK